MNQKAIFEIDGIPLFMDIQKSPTIPAGIATVPNARQLQKRSGLINSGRIFWTFPISVLFLLSRLN